ncbi:MAG: hypothetical protein IK016_01030, partial [Lachnospiraceae bacterium]|nr:hypothetical protein [Lachnospiraceae bacterium]
HFAGCNPWQSGPKNGLYRLWWKYAKKTPFYVELMEEQLWRAEGIESDGNAIGMREIEIRAIYEVAFSLKGKGLIKRWLINNHKVICIYGAGAMAEVLYELLEAEDAWCLVTGVFDRSKKGEMHGIPIENEVTRKDNAILVITPALKPNEIVKLIRKDTDWPYDIYILREFLYKVIL